MLLPRHHHSQHLNVAHRFSCERKKHPKPWIEMEISVSTSHWIHRQAFPPFDLMFAFAKHQRALFVRRPQLRIQLALPLRLTTTAKFNLLRCRRGRKNCVWKLSFRREAHISERALSIRFNWILADERWAWEATEQDKSVRCIDINLPKHEMLSRSSGNTSFTTLLEGSKWISFPSSQAIQFPSQAQLNDAACGGCFQ